MPRTSGIPRAGRPQPCPHGCAFSRSLGDHHDSLLAAATDPDKLLELLELAVTWSELDYSGAPLITPAQWLDFLHSHQWPDPERAERIFSLATDIAHRPHHQPTQHADAPAAGLRVVPAHAS